MSERFTKGPWRVLDNTPYSDREHHYQIITKDGGLWVAYTELCDSEEEEANAALIAAAPEMYAMLKELYDNLNRGMKYIISRRVKNGCPLDLARKCSANNIELARRIKALLKKARGES